MATIKKERDQGKGEKTIAISAPRFNIASVRIVGTSPYLQNMFGNKARIQMMQSMTLTKAEKAKKEKARRDFEEDFKQAQHISEDGWNGIPASAFRNACIDACRVAGYTMTRAKLNLVVVSDGIDKVDGQPLVRIIADKPEMSIMNGSIAKGKKNVVVRPIWKKWEAIVKIRFDADQFNIEDVVNLMSRAGQQVGIGEGRPFSRNSNGLGYGLFEVKEVSEVSHAKI